MELLEITKCVAAGLGAGILSGFFGVGGGIILIPLLILLFKMPQHSANGTSLVAMLLPVGLFAVMEYYRAGKINNSHIKMGLFISIGMFAGAYLSSKFAVQISADALKKAFSILLIASAVKLWFF